MAHRTSLGVCRSWWSGAQDSIPADHLLIPVHGNVGPRLVVVRSKVTVGGSKPLIESVLQGVELRSVAQVPGDRNPGHFRELRRATTLAFGWNNSLVPNPERNMSRLYIVTLLI